MSRVEGTVKWFSNRKGYGFITPTSENSPTEEDIFVHQTTVTSEGYRSLSEGWNVEFEVITDDDGKLKAINVTAPGGGPCTGPRVRRPRANQASAEGAENGGGPAKKERPQPQPKWHEDLMQEVQDALAEKSISTKTGTLDLALGSARIKLGTGGYTSMADSGHYLAEGTYEYSENGTITLRWERALTLEGNEWKMMSVDDVEPKTMSLTDDSLIPVGSEETAESLWGADTPKPRDELEANGFQMRQVVLTARPRRGRSHRG